MGLYADEYYAYVALRRKVKAIVRETLEQDATYKRLLGYIDLANANLDKVAQHIRENNLYYEDCEFVSFATDTSSLLDSSYEMSLHYKKDNEDKFAHFGVDSFLLILVQCGVLED
jgi:hypothetical protein